MTEVICTSGKIRYATESEARNARYEMVERWREEGQRRHKHPTRAYCCDVCHGWHLTSQASRKLKRKKRHR